MYRQFVARNFRCFESLEIRDLERINLIAGKNGVGKTTLLEAMFIHSGYFNPRLALTVDAIRGLSHIKVDESFWDLFAGFDPKKAIEIESVDVSADRRTLRITLEVPVRSRVPLGDGSNGRQDQERVAASTAAEESTRIPGWKLALDWSSSSGRHAHAEAYVHQGEMQFEGAIGTSEPLAAYLAARPDEGMATLATRLGNVAKTKGERGIIRILKILDPHLEDLRVYPEGGDVMIFGDVGGARLIPLPLLGDGILRVLRIALAISECQDGAVFVDEIENGLHHSVLTSVWQAVAEHARAYNTQIVATTHSWECIKAAHQAFASGARYDFRLHRLERVKDTIRAITYDQETLAAAIEAGIEVR